MVAGTLISHVWPLSCMLLKDEETLLDLTKGVGRLVQLGKPQFKMPASHIGMFGLRLGLLLNQFPAEAHPESSG